MKHKPRYYVYIIKCSKGTYYTGYTTDIERRISEHGTARGAKYLRGKTPVKLVWCKVYKYYKRAVDEERRIKELRRDQKEKLISGDIQKP